MRTKYKFGDRVPNNILADRLDGLAEAAKRLRKKCNSCSNGYDGTRGNGYQPCTCKERTIPAPAEGGVRDILIALKSEDKGSLWKGGIKKTTRRKE